MTSYECGNHWRPANSKQRPAHKPRGLLAGGLAAWLAGWVGRLFVFFVVDSFAKMHANMDAPFCVLECWAGWDGWAGWAGLVGLSGWVGLDWTGKHQPSNQFQVPTALTLSL